MSDTNKGRQVDGISVVVPVYRSTDSLRALVSRISVVLSEVNHEIILVDDGSPADTWHTVKELAGKSHAVVGVRLGRNAGQHSATLAGVRLASFPILVTLDDDLQNPPEEIPRLVACVTESFDLVYGTPESISRSSWRRFSSTQMRNLMSRLFGVANAQDLSSFRAFRTCLRDGFDFDLGPGVSIDALLAWSTNRVTSVNVAHDERETETSTYTLRKLLKFAVDTATGYSVRPLQLASLLGVATSFLGLVLLVGILSSVLVRGSSVPGFPFLASVTLLFSGIQLISLGMIGEYLARMHQRVMKMPTYVIAEVVDPGRPNLS